MERGPGVEVRWRLISYISTAKMEGGMEVEMEMALLLIKP